LEVEMNERNKNDKIKEKKLLWSSRSTRLALCPLPFPSIPLFAAKIYQFPHWGLVDNAGIYVGEWPDFTLGLQPRGRGCVRGEIFGDQIFGEHLGATPGPTFSGSGIRG